MNIVVTGGDSGIGLELVRLLVEDGVKVGLVVRHPSRLEALPEEVRTAHDLTHWVADLSVADDVIRVAEEIRASWGHVDILFNNAGIMLPDTRHSAQDRDMHLEVNTLAPMSLTLHLKPAFDAADQPLVINTVIGEMDSYEALDLDQLINPDSSRKMFVQYVESKLALLLWMNELAADTDWADVVIRCVNPGVNKTGMTGSDGEPWYIKLVRGLNLNPPPKGGKLVYDAASEKSYQRKSGIFIDERTPREIRAALTDEQRDILNGMLKRSE